MAIVGLVLAFVFSPAGLVVSIIAMRQTKNTPDRTGYVLALVGTIVSGASVAITVVTLLFYFFTMAFMFVPLVFMSR